MMNLLVLNWWRWMDFVIVRMGLVVDRRAISCGIVLGIMIGAVGGVRSTNVVRIEVGILFLLLINCI